MSFDAVSYVMGHVKGVKDATGTVEIDSDTCVFVDDGDGNLTCQPVDAQEEGE